MISHWTAQEYDQSIIAREGGDEPYEASGYVAVVRGAEACLSSFGHCSCYGTWDDLTGVHSCCAPDEADIDWDWIGTPEALIAMAQRMADPAMPERTISPDDTLHAELCSVYKQILEWNQNGHPVPNPKAKLN